MVADVLKTMPHLLHVMVADVIKSVPHLLHVMESDVVKKYHAHHYYQVVVYIIMQRSTLMNFYHPVRPYALCQH